MAAQQKGIIENVQHDKKRKMLRGTLTRPGRGGNVPFLAPYSMRLVPGDEVLYEQAPKTKATTRTMPRSWGSKRVTVVKVTRRSKTPMY
ncbi:hypothetical protein KY336_02265 [Candidatus Woesearchaeota archaeon]|nr:hypothetical protein [Candidatus Woesearchaeota archaeon]